MKNRFNHSVSEALKHFNDLAWLGSHSPLSSPYFLGAQLQRIDNPDSISGRGQALQSTLQIAADSLWSGPLPQSRRALEKAVEAERLEMGNGGPRYLYLLLDLRYLRRFFPPRTWPNTGRAIHTYLNVSETRFFVHLNSARTQLTKKLLQFIQPGLRLEKPILSAPLSGRNQIVLDILDDLKNRGSVSISGIGGIGKTAVGTAVTEAWESAASFWYTFHPGLNDDLASLIFSLGHFLHQWGFSNLWLQLMAQEGQVGSVAQALGFLREDLTQAAQLPVLLCFDELDLLQTAVSQPRHSEHRQILELLEGLKKASPLLLIGQRAILDTEAHYALNALSAEACAQMIVSRGIAPDELDLKRIYRLIEGNPRFIELYLALIHQTESNDEVRFLRSPALKPTFSRLWKRLTTDEKAILSQLAVFRTNVPADLWGNNAAYKALEDRKLLKADAFGGVGLLPIIRQLIYEELPAKSRAVYHHQAALIRLDRGQITEAAYHLCRAGAVGDAVTLWFANQTIEIEQGKAGAAHAIFSSLPAEGLSSAQAKKLKVIKDRLNLFYGQSAKILKDIDQYSWHPDEEITAVALQQWSEANFRLGQADEALQNLEEAITVLTNISTQITLVYFKRGKILLEQGKKYEAEKEILSAQFEIARLEGSIAVSSGNYLLAREFYEKALALAEKSSDEEKIARASYSLAKAIGNAGDPELAHKLAKPALEYYDRIGNRVRLEGLRAELAGAYLNVGQFEKVIEPAEKALQFFEKINHDVWVGHLSSNLAEAYFETGKIDLAEQFAYKAINTEHPIIPPYAIYTLGQIHAVRKKFDLAEQAFQQGIQLAQQIGDQFIEAYLHRICGQTLLDCGQIENARVRIQNALELFTALGLKHEVDKTEAILAPVA